MNLNINDLLLILQDYVWIILFLILGLTQVYLLIRIGRQQKEIIPKGRLIHFIYQSIATTDVQITEVIQQLSDLKQHQEEILLKLSKLNEQQREQQRQKTPHLFSSSSGDMAYVNAIKAIQSGKSLDEIALSYQLSRDELEILAAVYAPKVSENFLNKNLSAEDLKTQNLIDSNIIL